MEQALANAGLNHIDNVVFQAGEVGALLPQVSDQLSDGVDIVVLDPPRRGCDRPVLEALLALHPPRIVYMSCDPATLARDLKILMTEGGYHLTRVQPADFFPQTPHVECVAFLVA